MGSVKNILEDLSDCIMPLIRKLPENYQESIILYDFEQKHKNCTDC